MDVTFEILLASIEQLPLPIENSERHVHWCDKSQTLGVSRQESGAIELFLRGEELSVTSALVRRHLRFDSWEREGGSLFRANRLVLPSDDYFIPAAAFLAEELIRRDVEISISAAFSAVEPLIEMVLRRSSLSDDEVLGLISELRLLEVLISCSTDSRGKARALDSWKGCERGVRDFSLGAFGIEVKATRGNRSRHSVSSVLQVDPRRNIDGTPIEQLYLLSLGFSPVASSSPITDGYSLPSLVDSVLNQLKNDPGLQTLFLDKVSRYGVTSGRGYEHAEMKEWDAYQKRWQHSFIRIYDMCDPSVKVLRKMDLQTHGHVVVESVSFDIDFPERISGDLNPLSDLSVLATKFLK